MRIESVGDGWVRGRTLGKLEPFSGFACTASSAIDGYDCTAPTLEGREFTLYTQSRTCKVDGIGFSIDDHDNGLGDDCIYDCQRD